MEEKMEEEERGVVRVRVQKADGSQSLESKADGSQSPESRSFAVDPQITSLKVLQHILIRAFSLNRKQKFGLSFLSREQDRGQVYVPLSSDSDLDQAFVQASRPFLQLKMDLRPSEDSPLMDDWDIISPKDVLSSEQFFFSDKTRSLASAALPFTQSLLSQVGGTLSRVQQVFSWSYREEVKPFKPPLSDSEFHWYLNSQGQLTRPEELRLRIYHGGVEPSLRKVVWRYLLNVYPDGLTGQERMDYMKKKSREYEQLKREWLSRVGLEDLDFIRSNVLKDVLRTDRAHPYYAGSEDSPHLSALTDLLTTFAVTHPQISYCQGMSDIASPILAVMDNEAHAFICFCGIMKRLEGNFRPDGQLMSVKFLHLKLLLQYSDPEFFSYLVSRGADDLFFCYRWLLLELKREFVFDDALRMLEITWSSLPPDPPETEVELLGPPLEPQRPSETSGPSEPSESQTTFNGSSMEGLDDRGGAGRVEQRRRHMLRPSRHEINAPSDDQALPQNQALHQNQALPQIQLSRDHGERKSSFGEFKYYTTRASDSDLGRDLSQALDPNLPEALDPDVPEALDPDLPEASDPDLPKASDPDLPQASDPDLPQASDPDLPQASDPDLPQASDPDLPQASDPDLPQALDLTRSGSGPGLCSRQSTESEEDLGEKTPLITTPPDSSPSHCNHSNRPRSLLSSPLLSFGRSGPAAPPAASPCSRPVALPPPQEFGKGNPFMLFLCLSILLEHREHIVKNGLDYNELAMHFDRLVRRHHLGRVLQRAKSLFAEYLQSEVWESEEGHEVGSESPAAAVAPRSLYSPLSSPHTSPLLHSPRASPSPAHISPDSTHYNNSAHTSPNSTYNLATTVPSPSAQVSPT